MITQDIVEPPGKLFDVGGYCLHIQCQGSGRPAAVMDSGLNGNSLVWVKTLEAVGQFTQACAFDRAGYAWSDPAPPDKLRTSRQIVEELRILLAKAEIEPPYILVGHSSGAINMLYYAHTYPHEVTGLVLVDPSHPEMFERVEGAPSPEAMDRAYRIITGLASLGLMRWLGPLLVKQVLPDGAEQFPAQTWQTALVFYKRKQSYVTARREIQAFRDSCASARGGPGSLGDLPVRVLLADFWVTGKQNAMKQTFPVLCREHAQLSSRGKIEIVEGCDHTNLPIVRADAVAKAIREVLPG